MQFVSVAVLMSLTAGTVKAMSEEKLEIGGKEITDCEDEYIKPSLDAFKNSFKDYKSCNEETQIYIFSTMGIDTELQAGKNGNSNKYGLGFMCEGGNMYYIYTEDTDQATWDALKASPPDTSKVVLKCLIKEGTAGGPGAAADNSVRSTLGMAGLLGVAMLA